MRCLGATKQFMFYFMFKRHKLCLRGMRIRDTMEKRED